MAHNYDQLFKREFKEMMDARRAHITGFSLSSVPLPNFESFTKQEPTPLYLGHLNRRIAMVKGVSEVFFDRLNKTEVELVGRTKLFKRQALSDGSFRKDDKGNYVVDEITVPNKSVAVLSPISIGLKRFKEDARGNKVQHKPAEGYRYVDYVETKEGRKYIYIIPKEHVFRVSMVALMITHNRHRNFYHGVRVALQNGHYVYVYTAPYTYRENQGARIIGVKASTNLDAEVTHLLTHWQANKIMFPIKDTSFQDQVGGISNIGFQEMEGTLVVDDFVRYSVSLAEEGKDTLNN